ncbi:hypothetical protein CANARDRAFT_20127 [[Candida] arabinofermentans NRRL YB-2248]|uniref:Uncharacterized protein n=1 Tax=[Candida] arabinofermentans NRRL YB-2248 TaxID=983967 RepID=A0A1E4STI5_9ASCO|nr:hypothetical protein CANARDRAFT_20127 [[Candida] arabinofermentans NRRL YB-2248]
MSRFLVCEPFVYPGYEETSESYSISSSCIVPAGMRTLAISGQVGVDENGKPGETIADMVALAFENVGKAIMHAVPEFTKKEAFRSIYQITSYHSVEYGGITHEVGLTLGKTAKIVFGDYRPCWTAIGVSNIAVGCIEINILACVP